MAVENVSIGVSGTEYENWMSTPAIKIVGGVTALLGTTFFGTLAFTQNLPVKIGLGVLAVASFALLVDVVRIRKALSYSDGKVMDQMQKRLIAKLDWDGVGKALDVGCGSGTMTIRMAKVYPGSSVTGVDYWGKAWDYSLAQCEKNAEIEGVAERCTFVKGDAAKLEFADETFDALTANCVYSQIMGSNSMENLIKESLRTLKIGAPFAIQDYFDREKMFGSINDLMCALKDWGVSEIHYQGGLDCELPRQVIRPYCIKGTGILWGKR